MKHILLATLLIGTTAHADYKLAHNGKKVVCYADDNQSWELNKSRTTLKYTVEGESLGPSKIFDKNTDGKTYISYSSDEGTLTLSNKGDSFQFAEADDSFEIDCR